MRNTSIDLKGTAKSIEGSFIDQRETDNSNRELFALPSSFNDIITDYLEGSRAEVSICSFYYCMKFILIKPAHTSTEPLNLYYNIFSIEDLIKLKSNAMVRLQLSCFKVK